MSASNSMPSSGPPTEGRVYEPSMEEILASIRRIIADDQSLPSPDMFRREPAAEVHQAEVRQVEVRQADVRQADPPPNDPPRDVRGASSAPEPFEAPAPVAESAESRQIAEPVAFADPASNIRWVTREPTIEPELQVSQKSPVPHPEAHGLVAAPQYPGPDERAFAEDLDAPVEHAHPAEEPAPQAVTPHAQERAHEIVDDAYSDPEPLPPTAEMFDEPIEPPAPAEPATAAASLFSSATDTAVSSAFNVLAASRLAANSDEIMNLVREMIRPLLRNWLDDNLPSMVERIVRDEIERVARGGR